MFIQYHIIMIEKTFDVSHSYGTFGFWTAFLKQQGDVILATGSTKVPTLSEVRYSLPQWTFLNDPCFNKDSNGNVKQADNCD